MTRLMEMHDVTCSLKCKRGDTSPPSGSDSPASRDPAHAHAVVCKALTVLLSGIHIEHSALPCSVAIIISAALLDCGDTLCSCNQWNIARSGIYFDHCAVPCSCAVTSASLLSSGASVPQIARYLVLQVHEGQL